MNAQLKTSGVLVGSIAAAATTGALIAMGHRAGHAALLFAAIGAVPFRRSADSGAVGLVFGGLALHVAAMFLWSMVYVWLVTRAGRPLLLATLVAAANFFVSWAIARSSGKGLSTALPLGDRLAFALILTIALVVGMRYAFSAVRRPRSDGPDLFA